MGKAYLDFHPNLLSFCGNPLNSITIHGLRQQKPMGLSAHLLLRAAIEGDNTNPDKFPALIETFRVLW